MLHVIPWLDQVLHLDFMIMETALIFILFKCLNLMNDKYEKLNNIQFAIVGVIN